MSGPRRGEVLALWVGLLGGPVAWAAQFQWVYALAPWACEGGPMAALHLIAACCLAASAGAGLLAYRNWQTVGGWPEGTGAEPAGRVRLMGVVGMMTASLFSLVI